MYPKKYFKECQLKITKDLKVSIENDTKIENIEYILRGYDKFDQKLKALGVDIRIV